MKDKAKRRGGNLSVGVLVNGAFMDGIIGTAGFNKPLL